MVDFQQAPPRPNSFKCSTAWHLRTSGLALAIYDVIAALTYAGKDEDGNTIRNDYYTSIAKMAHYLYPEKTGEDFKSAYNSTARAFGVLRDMGFLERVFREGESDAHRLVEHEEWAQKHPGKCHDRELLPWQGDELTDPLVRQLYAISSGKLRMLEHHVAGLRKYAALVPEFLNVPETRDKTDARILDAYREAMKFAEAKKSAGQWDGTSPRAILRSVYKFFKSQAAIAVENRPDVARRTIEEFLADSAPSHF